MYILREIMTRLLNSAACFPCMCRACWIFMVVFWGCMWIHVWQLSSFQTTVRISWFNVLISVYAFWFLKSDSFSWFVIDCEIGDNNFLLIMWSHFRIISAFTYLNYQERSMIACLLYFFSITRYKRFKLTTFINL